MDYSIKDIAKLAGVSKSTVSRVLNGGSVSPKAQEAVRAVLRETGYRPNLSARTLRGVRSYVVGIPVASPARILTNQADHVRLASMIETLYRYGYSVLLINEAQQPYSEMTPFRLLEQHTVDGLIFLENGSDEATRKEICRHREVVYTGERIDPERGFRISMGNYEYSKCLYTHLMRKGHRKITTVLSYWCHPIGEQRRYDAYCDACREFGIRPSPDSFLSFGGYAEEREGLETLYRRVVRGDCTAIFIDNVRSAANIDHDFARRGLTAGKEFSLVTIERSSAKWRLQEEYTAVVLPDEEYGKQAVKMLLKVLENPELEYLDCKIPFVLRERNSVAVVKEER